MAEVVLSDMGFSYPIVLSAFYTACNWAGAAVFHREMVADEQRLTRRQWTLVSVLSISTALNTLIGRANIAVPSTFDQVVQAAGPVMVLFLATRVFKRSVSRERQMAVIPVVIGVAMAWFANMEVTMSAAVVSGACVALNASKVVIWSEMLTGKNKVTPLHLLSRVSPMTFIQVTTYALFRGEVSDMVGQWRVILTGWALHLIAVTGVVSFVMTVLSMHATTFATPLTVSVSGALKQIAVIGFSIWRMSRPMTRMNLLGVMLAAAGGVRYVIVSRRERKVRDDRGKLSTDPKKEKDASNSSGPLLPTTTGPTGAMVNGKRPRNKGKTEKNVRLTNWGGWWGSGKGNALRRSR